jgi:hypothetical protein
MRKKISVLLTMSSFEIGFDTRFGVADGLAMVNALLARHHQPPLSEMTWSMQRCRRPQAFTFGGGYCGFPADEFIALVATFDWLYPQNVVLVLQPGSGSVLTRVWRPSATIHHFPSSKPALSSPQERTPS